MTLTRTVEPRESKQIVLGHKYKDVVTGIEGTATVVYIHLTGCDQVALSHMVKGEQKWLTVDVTRLEGIEVPDGRPGAGEVPPSSKLPT